jgi:hypothetical protein
MDLITHPWGMNMTRSHWGSTLGRQSNTTLDMSGFPKNPIKSKILSDEENFLAAILN